MFSFEICKIFQGTYFEEHLRKFYGNLKLEANKKQFYLEENLSNVYFKQWNWFGYISVVYQLKFFIEPFSNRELG